MIDKDFEDEANSNEIKKIEHNDYTSREALAAQSYGRGNYAYGIYRSIASQGFYQGILWRDANPRSEPGPSVSRSPDENERMWFQMGLRSKVVMTLRNEMKCIAENHGMYDVGHLETIAEKALSAFDQAKGGE